MTPEKINLVRYQGRLEQLEADRTYLNSTHYWAEKKKLTSLIGILEVLNDVEENCVNPSRCNPNIYD